EYRGRGVSRAIIRSLLARESGPVLLMCYGHLMGYYASFGFVREPAHHAPFGLFWRWAVLTILAAVPRLGWPSRARSDARASGEATSTDALREGAPVTRGAVIMRHPGPTALGGEAGRIAASGAMTPPSAIRASDTDLSDRPGRGFLAAGWPYLLSTVVALILRSPTLSNHIYSIDEPAYFAQAARLQSLSAFVYAFSYRVEIKSQIGLLPFMLARALSTENAVLILHLFGLLAALLTCLVLIRFSTRFLATPLPGLLAAIIWLVYLGIGTGTYFGPIGVGEWFLATNLEYFQAPVIVSGLYGLGVLAAASRPLQRRTYAVLGGVGAAVALAVLIKPGAILLAPVYLGAIPYLWPGGVRGQGRAIRMGIGAFLLGGMIPAGLVFGPYLLNAAALAELRFNLLDSAVPYTAGLDLPGRMRFLLDGLPWVLRGLYLTVVPLVLLQRRGQDPRPVYRLLIVVALTGPALIIGYLPGQTYVHYLVPAVPVLALAVSGYLGRYLAGLPDGRRWRAGVLGSTVLLFANILPVVPAAAANYLPNQPPGGRPVPGPILTDFYRAEDRRRFDVDGVVTFIQTHTRPDARVWAYYNVPELYLWSNRQPATRDPAVQWLTFMWHEPWFSRTVADLTTEQPDLIVGVTAPRFAKAYVGGLLDIPQVGALIQREYHCGQPVVRGALLCIRNGAPVVP
ncbi:MAG TPA: hypothetical protein VM536_08820, partial [Chloroflexia bacterium]|nr:hypothetical protein [Chloroflexia bacterium]